jgi:hypothetical protein
VNGQGLISVRSKNSGEIDVSCLIIKNIEINSTANGSISFIGDFENICIKNSEFIDIESANYGGALYFDVNMNNNGKVLITNTVFKSCRANIGGAIYIEAGVLDLTDVEFSDNYDNNNNEGNDIVSVKIGDYVHFKGLTCSYSEETHYKCNCKKKLPSCSDLSNIRYVKTTGSDENNVCLNSKYPCRSLSTCLSVHNKGETLEIHLLDDFNDGKFEISETFVGVGVKISGYYDGLSM